MLLTATRRPWVWTHPLEAPCEPDGIREVFQPAVLRGWNVGIVHQTLAKMFGGGRRKSTLPGGARPGARWAGVARAFLRCRVGSQLVRRQPAPSLAAASPGWRPRLETALECPDQALELAHTLAQGRVFGLEAGECGGRRRLGTRLPPPGDAAARGADALRAAARQEAAADRAQTGP
jgi:hypothetical protein